MVLNICAQLKREILQEQISDCTVHSVYRAVVNLMTPQERLISLTLAGRQTMPYGIVTDALAPFAFEQGEPLRLTENGLYRGNCLLLSCLQAPSYDCRAHLIAPLSGVGALERKRKMMRRLIASDGNQDGIAGLLEEHHAGRHDHQLFVKPIFDRFLAAYRQQDLDDVTRLAEKLCGYGIGLTPYMDDFFCGLMTVEHYAALCVPQEAQTSRAVIDAVMRNLKYKTNLVSYNMLMQAAEGLFSGGILALMQALLTGEDEHLDDCVRQVFAYGSSSGTDICCGILTGLSRNMGE